MGLRPAANGLLRFAGRAGPVDGLLQVDATIKSRFAGVAIDGDTSTEWLASADVIGRVPDTSSPQTVAEDDPDVVSDAVVLKRDRCPIIQKDSPVEFG